MFGIIIDLLGTVALVVLVASIICTITPTPKDNKIMAKFYKIIEICALNIGKAKD
tara:strand:- start:972 stop:1136 length:165 start_codon:yes stop_codon:yes gene_type:complete